MVLLALSLRDTGTVSCRFPMSRFKQCQILGICAHVLNALADPLMNQEDYMSLTPCNTVKDWPPPLLGQVTPPSRVARPGVNTVQSNKDCKVSAESF